jgi:hypothetical protein
MVNRPSTEHNSWVGILTWRNYATALKKTLNAPKMLWTAYRGEITHGIEEFTHEHGLLKGKGYNMNKIANSSRRNFNRTKAGIDEGRHAPW